MNRRKRNSLATEFASECVAENGFGSASLQQAQLPRLRPDCSGSISSHHAAAFDPDVSGVPHPPLQPQVHPHRFFRSTRVPLAVTCDARFEQDQTSASATDVTRRESTRKEGAIGFGDAGVDAGPLLCVSTSPSSGAAGLTPQRRSASPPLGGDGPSSFASYEARDDEFELLSASVRGYSRSSVKVKSQLRPSTALR